MASNGAESRTGYGKGIQGWNNSCYLDSVFMSLFYGSTCLDKIFLKEYPVSTNTEYFRKVSLHLSKVVSTLRGHNYCPKELILQLRATLAKVNPNITGEMEDVADFLLLLSKNGLGLEPFLTYTGGGSNFYHQIVLKQNSANAQAAVPSVANLQTLLIESLSAQRISIQQLNSPLLAIKVPRANGILVKHQGILPPLNLDFHTSVGAKVSLALQAVICLKHCHYTCFIRSKKQWVFYDSMAAGGLPEVKPLPEMESIMTEWARRLPVSCSTDNLRLPVNEKNLYLRILTDIHMCFYVAPNATKDFGFYNTPSSLPIQVQTQPGANVSRANVPSSNSSSRDLSVLHFQRRVTPVPVPAASSSVLRIATITVLPHSMQHNATFIPASTQSRTETVVSRFPSWKSIFPTFNWPFSYDLNNCWEALMQNGRVKQLKNNKYPRIGISQGIEMSKSYKSHRFLLESFVFALFSNTRRNDRLYCQIISPNSTPEYVDRATNMQIVVEALRYHPYLCKEQLITKLYSSLRIPSTKVPDVADLVLLLFKDALPQMPFIRQEKNVSTFLHHIVIPNEPRKMLVRTKQLLILSMQYQNVNFLTLQGPLLIIIQRNVLGGKRLVVDLTLQTSGIFPGMAPNLTLTGFISRDKHGNYKSYARYNSDQAGVKKYCWVSMGIRKDGKPEVKACPNIEPQILKSYERTEWRSSASERSQNKTKDIWEIVKDIELLIYC